MLYDRDWTTTSFYKAAYLVAKGLQVARVDYPEGRAVLVFTDPQAWDLFRGYTTDPVIPSLYVDALQRVRDLCFQRRDQAEALMAKDIPDVAGVQTAGLRGGVCLAVICPYCGETHYHGQHGRKTVQSHCHHNKPYRIVGV